jgi:hypothetical protein
MATVKLSGPAQVNQVLTAMKNNTGAARIDEYYFQTNDVAIEDLYDNAFKKSVIVNVVPVYGNIQKLTYNLILI